MAGQILAAAITTASAAAIGTALVWSVWPSDADAASQGLTSLTGKSPVVSTDAVPATALQVNNAAGAAVFAVTTNATVASSNATAAGTLTANKGVITPALTVATLPGSPTAGQRSFVTDATACTFNSAVTGGAAVKCPVVYNGTTILSPGTITIHAPTVAVQGDLTVTGTVVAQGDVTGNGTSLHTHKHSRVTTGSGNTGNPV